MNKYQESLDRIDQYRVNKNLKIDIKDILTLQELVDKQTPKKVINKHKEYVFPKKYRLSGLCSNCKNHVNESKYCHNCGQALDWSE